MQQPIPAAVEDLGLDEASLEDEDAGVELGRTLAQLLEYGDIDARRGAAIVLHLHTAHKVERGYAFETGLLQGLLASATPQDTAVEILRIVLLNPAPGYSEIAMLASLAGSAHSVVPQHVIVELIRACGSTNWTAEQVVEFIATCAAEWFEPGYDHRQLLEVALLVTSFWAAPPTHRLTDAQRQHLGQALQGRALLLQIMPLL